MGQSKYYHYFVEGEDEEKLIQVLKTDLRLIVPGKVQKFNVVEAKINAFAADVPEGRDNGSIGI